MVSEFYNNIRKKLRRVFTNKGIVIGSYRFSYRIIPVALICLLALIIFFSLIGRLFKGGKTPKPADTPTPTQSEETANNTPGDGQEATPETQEPQENIGSTENDGENYYAIMKGTEQKALFATEAEANKFLSDIKAEFVDPNDKSAKVTIEPELKVEKVPQSENSAENLTKDARALLNTLLYGSNEENIYITTDSDTMWDIAVAHGIGVEELLAANPDIDPNSLHGGMEVKIKVGQGEVSVKAEYETTKEEDIPYDTIYEESSDLYAGEEEIVTWGRKGRKAITTKTTKINGITVSEEITEEEIITEAVTEVIKTGITGGDDSSEEEGSEESQEEEGESTEEDTAE